jgi:23S rRNA (adenine2503-C2)-methyltransferase
MKVNAHGLTLDELSNHIIALEEKPYRARQVYHWITAKAAQSFDEMTDLPKALRAKLSEVFSLELPEVIEIQTAQDGTTKFALLLKDGEVIEMVLIPERDHFTLCVSSQVGCSMGCKFCLTARSGFKRNLEAWEIISQVVLAKRWLKDFLSPRAKRGVSPVVLAKRWLKEKEENLPLRNIVFMGMGEPLANYTNLVKSLKILADQEGFNFSRKRLTVSTAGIVPKIWALAKDFPTALAVSLHSADQSLRDYLMPGVKKYPLSDLWESIKAFPRIKNGRTTIEYILLKDINDGEEHAEKLYRFLKGLKVKVNLIPFNPHPELPFKRPEPERVEAFQRYLLNRGVLTTVRKSKGLEISAACGQLRRRVLSPNSFQAVSAEGASSICV